LKFKVVTKQGEKFPKWYYGKAYEVYDLNKAVWVIIPFHAIVKIGRYARQVWNMWRGRKTWFDRQWIDAYELGFRKGWFRRIEQESHSKYQIDEIRRKLKLTNEGQINATIN